MSIFDAHQAVFAHLRNLGIFDKVAKHEPANVPGKGIYAAMWFDDGELQQELSSLTAAGAQHVVKVRMYKNATSEPQDSIDLDLIAALDGVIAALVADHTLGGSVFSVDVLGAYGDAINWATDYVDFGQNKWYRIVDLFVPLTLEGTYSYAS